MWYKIFKLKELNSTPKTEFLAGLTTFLTMSYIIFVNPMFLSFFGDPNLENIALPVSASITATCLAAALMCFFMGLWSNYPFALAPGMGLNAIVAYQMVLGLKLSWPEAMGVIVMEGLIITFLVITGFREAVMNAIPQSLKQAISVGIGLFLTFIGLIQAGLVKKSESTLVSLGEFDNWGVLVSLLGLFFTAVLMKRKIKGAILLGILFSTLLAVIINSLSGFKAFAGEEIAKLPSSFISWPDFSTFGDFNFGAIGKLGLLSSLILIFSVMLSDFFDTLGSVVGLGTQGNFLDAQGEFAENKSSLTGGFSRSCFWGCGLRQFSHHLYRKCSRYLFRGENWFNRRGGGNSFSFRDVLLTRAKNSSQRGGGSGFDYSGIFDVVPN